MFFYFRSAENLTTLQHLNISHNLLKYINMNIEGFSNKTILETIDLSNNQLDLKYFNTIDFFQRLQPKNIFINKNGIRDFPRKIIDKLTRILDLSENKISYINVSVIYA